MESSFLTEKKYVLCKPSGGFNDQLSRIDECLHYCEKYNRTLLIDTTGTCYRYNFSDYFSVNSTKINTTIICDTNQIKPIVNEINNKDIFPSHVKDSLFVVDKINIFRGNPYEECELHNGTSDGRLSIFFSFDNDYTEKVLVYIKNGGGDGYNFFKKLIPKKVLLDDFTLKYAQLSTTPYTSFQVRNTDIKCNYPELLYSFISTSNVFLATDCKEVLQFFESSLKEFTIYNFTHFHSDSYWNLHSSKEVSGEVKLKDMFSDLLLMGMSQEIISNSKGGYIELARKIFDNKNELSYLKELFFLR